MQQGTETFNSHSFDEYLAISLGMHKEAVLDFILRTSHVRILDIGCGTGGALAELRKFCENKRIPNAQFFGLDIAAQPVNFPEGMTYIQGDISQFESDRYGKFDLIISVNTFQYVPDKEAALKNIAKLLSLRGKAFISIEPYYFGTNGVNLFNDSNCCKWDADYRNLLVSPQQNPVLINSATFFAHPFPSALASIIWRNGKREQVSMPAVYTAALVQKIKRRDDLVEERGRGIYWGMLAFLECRTPNPNGPTNCGREGFRPFQFGVIDRVWLCQPNLTEIEVARILTESSLWDAHSVQQNFVPPKDYIEVVSHMFEIKLGEQNFEDKIKHLDSVANIEYFKKKNHEWFTPKNLIIVLGVSLFLLGLLIKWFAAANPSVGNVSKPR